MKLNIKYLALSLIFCFASQSHAQNESVMDNNPVFFSSMDLAAIDGLKKAVAMSSKYEFAGCIYHSSEGFVATKPASSGAAGEFDIFCQATSEFKLVAIFHTHPEGSIKGISVQDIRIAKELKVTSYVAFMDQRKIVKYVPGSTRLQCINGSSVCSVSQKISMGDFVAKY